MLRRFKFVIVGALTVLASAAASYAAVSAAMPEALLPSGTARFATASASSSESIEFLDGWVDVPGMTKYITIPGGQTADVMVIFCGHVATDTGVELRARAMVRDVLASPSWSPMKYSDNFSASQCVTFSKTNVTAGSPAVKIQWYASGAGAVYIGTRSMILIVNIH
jgi:hypothetical protein